MDCGVIPSDGFVCSYAGETEEVDLVELIDAGEVAWSVADQSKTKKKAEVRG